MADEVFDAIVIGSGASGGVAAWQLSTAGMRVLLLEAGRNIDPKADFDHRVGWEPRVPAKRTDRQPIQSRTMGYDDLNKHLFIDDLNNPYCSSSDPSFLWIRSRMLGGRSLTWGKVCPRFNDHDLKASERDGIGEPWPLSLSELIPYYEKIEEILSVPPPMAASCIEDPQIAPSAKKFEKLMKVRWPKRELLACQRAKPRLSRLNETPYVGLPYTASPSFFIGSAIRTGKMKLRTNAVVSRITVDSNTGMAEGVEFLDGETGRPEVVRGRRILLCASTIESVRIMLNSACPQHPEGLANSSGELGRWLMDHVCGLKVAGHIDPSELGLKPRAPILMDFYVPDDGRESSDFLRGYASMLGFFPCREDPEKFSFYSLLFGEVLPNRENRICISKDQKDKWGIPSAHIHFSYGENEQKMTKHAAGFLKELALSWGVDVIHEDSNPSAPGESIHEVGGARMGSDPRKSVLNGFNQAWDVKNLFVLDGACFPSAGTQNPTLTIMALASRACDYIIAESRRRNL
jgi:choline dehydrogenase-like flavoprotein